MEFLTPLLGNIGTVILLIIVWKSGLLKYLMEAKNGNGIEKKMNTLEQHFNHEITDTLKRIEERLNDIHDGIVYLKAKQNGK